MEPNDTIEKISKNLREIQSEHEIYNLINDSLTYLRKIYRGNKTSFSEEDIKFLKSVVEINDYIHNFIELYSYIDLVSSIESYEDLVKELNEIRDKLSNFAVVVNVKKAIRHLKHRIPDINRLSQVRVEKNISKNISILEKNPPLCYSGHPMVIRKGEYGYFWGCSKFPNCLYTKDRNKREKYNLFSDLDLSAPF